MGKDKRNDYVALSNFFESSWFGSHEPSAEELHDYDQISKMLINA